MNKDEMVEKYRKMRQDMSPTPIRKSVSNVPEREFEFDKNQFSIAKYFRGAIRNDWHDAELEKREYKRLSKATLGATVGAQGAFLIPEETTQEIMSMLKAKAVIRGSGARIYPLSGETMKIRGQSAALSGGWVGKGEAATEQSATDMFAVDTLTLKKYMSVVSVGNDLIENASPAVDAIIRNDLAEEIALAEDLAFLEGDGNKEPLGIYNDPDIPAANQTTLDSTIDYDDLIDVQGDVEAQNGDYTHWIMHPNLKNYVRKIKDGNGNYIWTDGDVKAGEPATLLGLPVLLSSQISTSVTSAGALSGGSYTYVILANMPDYAIAQKSGDRLEMKMSDVAEDAFVTDETWMRAKMKVDGLCRHPKSWGIVTAVHLS